MGSYLYIVHVFFLTTKCGDSKTPTNNGVVLFQIRLHMSETRSESMAILFLDFIFSGMDSPVRR